MSIDVDVLAEEMVRGAQLLVAKAMAEVRAENVALRGEIASMAERVAQLEARAPVPGPEGPPGRDGVDGRDGIDGKDGLNGIDGKDGAPGERGPEGPPGRDGKDGEAGKDGAPGRDGIDGKDGAPGRDGADGKDGAQGERGPEGKMPTIRAWVDGVYYALDCVTHNGATWQAIRDTGHAPPHADWACIAARGADGIGITPRGTWTEGEIYTRNDIVAMNGGSFVALQDNPGVCPGPYWQLLTSPGKRGQKGEDGGRGAPGERGERGPAIIAAERDGRKIVFTDDQGDQIEVDFG